MRKMYFLIAIVSTLTLFSNCKDKKDNPTPPERMPRLAIEGFGIAEGTGGTTNAAFTVSLDTVSSSVVTVDYQTVDGNALLGMDYGPVSGTLTFQPGETQQLIEVAIVGDEIKEVKEIFEMKLSNPSNATPAELSAVGTIQNDDDRSPMAADGYITPTTYPNWELKWSDEFDGTEINTTDWGFDLGDGCPDLCGWGNNELESYTDLPENVFLQDGHLTIRALHGGGDNYTSTRMNTKGKKKFRYGRIDVRARMPKGQGLWPAIWMLGSNIDQVGWPACGEIDIMELVGHEPSTAHGTGHWGQEFSQRQSRGESFRLTDGKEFADDFHVFSIAWEVGKIYWFIDDIHFYEHSTAQSNGQPYPFNGEFFFILNVAVGGNWPGNPDATTQFPQEMVVDYIRVFQK